MSQPDYFPQSDEPDPGQESRVPSAESGSDIPEHLRLGQELYTVARQIYESNLPDFDVSSQVHVDVVGGQPKHRRHHFDYHYKIRPNFEDGVRQDDFWIVASGYEMEHGVPGGLSIRVKPNGTGVITSTGLGSRSLQEKASAGADDIISYAIAKGSGRNGYRLTRRLSAHTKSRVGTTLDCIKAGEIVNPNRDMVIDRPRKDQDWDAEPDKWTRRVYKRKSIRLFGQTALHTMRNFDK
jgi:hypothetical protein